MLARRIIPCLDIDKGRVVKGVNFVNIIDAGDPIENARFYNDEGADEIVFLDITASHEKRKTMIEIAENVAKEIFIPFTIGGGIGSQSDIRALLNAGADKVSINSYAVRNPEFIKEASRAFGSSTIVVAIDAKQVSNKKWNVFINGGRIDTGIDAVEWACRMNEYGCGEILLTSMDKDGTKSGFDNELNYAVTTAVNVPVIASGGAGKMEDFESAFETGGVQAALAASLFHFRDIKIGELKAYLQKKGVPIRMIK